MTDQAETVSEIDRLRAFAQRMQAEGAAGFADGPEPWEHWQQPEYTENPAWERHMHSSGRTGKTVCEKLMSGVAGVAVLALALGIGGIWITSDTSTPPLAANQVEPEEVDAGSKPAGSTRPNTVIRRDTLPPHWHQASDELPASRTVRNRPVDPLHLAIPTIDTEGSSASAAGNQYELITTLQTPARADAPPASPLNELPAPAAGDDQVAVATAATARNNQTEPATAAIPAGDSPDRAEAVTTGGPWAVNISAYADRSLALEKIEEFRSKGVNAELVPITSNGKPMHRIRVSGYDSKGEAITWVSLLEERLGIDGAWVSKR